MDNNYFYINFHYDKNRISSLLKIFHELQNVKNKLANEELEYSIDISSDPRWRTLLDSEALIWFKNTLDFQSKEGKVYKKLWELTKPEIRNKDPFFILPGNWDFESLIDAILCGEYSLIDIAVDEKTTEAILYYDPWAYPFGGTGS